MQSSENLLFNSYKDKLNAGGSKSVCAQYDVSHSMILGIIMMQLQRTG